MPNTFSINDYKGEFARFFVTKESSIFLFMELVRTNYALWGALIFHPNQVLVDKEEIERFEEFAKDLNICFLKENGAIFTGKPPYDDEYYDHNLPIAKHLRDKRVERLKAEGRL